MRPFAKKKAQPPRFSLLAGLLRALSQFYGAGLEVCLGLDSPGLGGNSITFFFLFSKSYSYLTLTFACSIMFYYSGNFLMLIVTAKIYSCEIPIAFWGNSEAELDIQEKSLQRRGESWESYAITCLNPALSSYEFTCHGQSPVAPWVCGIEDMGRKAFRKESK